MTDQAASNEMGRPRRGALPWLVAAVVGLIAAVLAATITDGARSNESFGVVRERERPLPEQPAEAVGPFDPGVEANLGGAQIGIEDGSAPVEGLPDGTWIMELDVIEEARRGVAAPPGPGIDTNVADPVPEGATPTGPTTLPGQDSTPTGPTATATGPAAPTDPAPTATTAEPTPTPGPGESPGAPLPSEIDLGSWANDLGQIELTTPTPDITHFVDTCAEGDEPCPPGEAGTVVAFAGGVGGSDTMEIKLWPGLNGLTAKNLGCTPGYQTSTRLPVIVTADAPVGWISVELRIDGVADLDSVYINVGDPKQKADWAARVKAGLPVGTDLSNSIHYCFSLRTEGDPSNAAALAGTKLPDGAQYTVTAKALALDGPSQATAAAVHPITTGTYDRPPTEIWPYSTHRAQVIVPQIDGTASQVRVWAEGSTWMDQQCSTFGPGAGAPNGAEYISSYPSAEPRKLTVPSDPYPYDRAFSHFTVWNLMLRDEAQYVVCVQWRAPDGTWGPYETWNVETPEALRLRLHAGPFSAKGSDVQFSYTVRAEGIVGCYRYVLNTNDPSGGSYGWACDSRGWPVPQVTRIIMERQDLKTGAYSSMGDRRIVTPTVCQPGQLGTGGVNVPSYVLKLPCKPNSHSLTLYWMTANVLCGGPWGGCPDDDVDATLQAEISLFEDLYQGREGALNWGISLENATYGTSLPGAGQPGPP